MCCVDVMRHVVVCLFCGLQKKNDGQDNKHQQQNIQPTKATSAQVVCGVVLCSVVLCCIVCIAGVWYVRTVLLVLFVFGGVCAVCRYAFVDDCARLLIYVWSVLFCVYSCCVCLFVWL